MLALKNPDFSSSSVYYHFSKWRNLIGKSKVETYKKVFAKVLEFLLLITADVSWCLHVSVLYMYCVYEFFWVAGGR